LKQFVVLIILLFLFIVSYAQNRKAFVLNGIIKGRDTGKIILTYPVTNNQFIRDTTYVQKGKFQFSGKIFQPSSSSLRGSAREGNIIYFYLEPGNQYVFLGESKFEDIRMTGSYTQNQNDTLQKQIKKIELKNEKWLKQRDSLLRELEKTNDKLTRNEIKSKLSQFDEKVDMLNNEMLNAMVTFISEHPDSYVSPTDLYIILVSNRLKTETVDTLFLKFSDKIKNSFDGILISEEINKRKINTKVPDFSAKDIDNNQIRLSEFEGKHVLLNFWASWCAPCIKKIPELKNFFSFYHSKGFEIINISIDAKRENWVKAVNKYKLESFHNVITNEDIENKYSNTKMPIPSEILVGPTGLMLWNSMNLNSKSLEQALNDCVAK